MVPLEVKTWDVHQIISAKIESNRRHNPTCAPHTYTCNEIGSEHELLRLGFGCSVSHSRNGREEKRVGVPSGCSSPKKTTDDFLAPGGGTRPGRRRWSARERERGSRKGTGMARMEPKSSNVAYGDSPLHPSNLRRPLGSNVETRGTHLAGHTGG
jgi:hypothetical protein